MRVLFVNYHHLDSNSGIHIFNLANQLTRLGVECMVCVPDHKEKVHSLGSALFEVVNIEDLRKNGLPKKIDLIHAWTPREIVRKITNEILSMQMCPYVVHMEDNEEFLVESYTRLPISTLRRLPAFLLNLLVRPYMSHPFYYREFLEGAKGITLIMDTLKEYCPSNIPTKVIWAGYEEDMQWNVPYSMNFKERLGLEDNVFTIAYTGNLHAVNQGELLNLYKAVELINNMGFRVKLIRTGADQVRILSHGIRSRRKKYSIELGRISRNELPLLFSVVDVLIQPGNSGKFNDYRFPSKLPEYFASGKPVILPKSNIGNYLKDNEECVFLEGGGPLEIARKLEYLLVNVDLQKKIGSNGRKFAEQNLRWGHITEGLYTFYISLLEKNSWNQRMF